MQIIVDKNNGIPISQTNVPTGTRVYNNSFSAPTAFGVNSFWAVNFNDATPVGTVIQNNVGYAPIDTLHKLVNEAVAQVNSYTASNNSTTAQTGATSPLWVTTPLAVVGDWYLQAGSYAKNAGTDVPVWSDFFGTTRSSGSMDIGATEQ